jgi:hypothetical protein
MGSISPEFAAALVSIQGELEGAKKDKLNPGFRSKYADLGACWDACRDALQKYGVAVLQFPMISAQHGSVGIETHLVFSKTGEILSQSYDVPLKDATNPQALGSAITYGRRYALCSVLGICPEDDDGNAAAGTKFKQDRRDQPTNTSVDAYLKQFGAATDVAGKKQAYLDLKNSSVQEPVKTSTLTELAKAIKALQETSK